MLKHIVVWKLKPQAECNERSENMRIMKEKLMALPAIIPQIRTFFVGFDVVQNQGISYDVCLESEFDNESDLQIYRDHPNHLAVAKFAMSVAESRYTVDYWK